jgi:hypothetical protein
VIVKKSEIMLEIVSQYLPRIDDFLSKHGFVRKPRKPTYTRDLEKVSQELIFDIDKKSNGFALRVYFSIETKELEGIESDVSKHYDKRKNLETSQKFAKVIIGQSIGFELPKNREVFWNFVSTSELTNIFEDLLTNLKKSIEFFDRYRSIEQIFNAYSNSIPEVSMANQFALLIYTTRTKERYIWLDFAKKYFLNNQSWHFEGESVLKALGIEET